MKEVEITAISRQFTAAGLKDNQIAQLLNAATAALQQLPGADQLPQSTRQVLHDAVVGYLRLEHLAIDQTSHTSPQSAVHTLVEAELAVRFCGTFRVTGPALPPESVRVLPIPAQLELFQQLAALVANAAAQLTYTQHCGAQQTSIGRELQTQLRRLSSLYGIVPTILRQWLEGMRVSDVTGTWSVAIPTIMLQEIRTDA